MKLVCVKSRVSTCKFLTLASQPFRAIARNLLDGDTINAIEHIATTIIFIFFFLTEDVPDIIRPTPGSELVIIDLQVVPIRLDTTVCLIDFHLRYRLPHGSKLGQPLCLRVLERRRHGIDFLQVECQDVNRKIVFFYQNEKSSHSDLNVKDIACNLEKREKQLEQSNLMDHN